MKIICIGRNYAAHAAELGNEIPKDPLIFMKPSTAISPDGKPFFIPDFSDNIHFELEVVVRVKMNGKAIQPEFAHRYYDDIALGIDFTARDLQDKLKDKGHPWEIAKGFDHSAYMSPFRPITDDERANGIQFKMYQNGECVQKGDTKLMIHSIDDILCYVSQFFKLHIGDYIFTGTPAGVGQVHPGDILVGELAGEEYLRCEVK